MLAVSTLYRKWYSDKLTSNMKIAFRYFQTFDAVQTRNDRRENFNTSSPGRSTIAEHLKLIITNKYCYFYSFTHPHFMKFCREHNKSDRQEENVKNSSRSHWPTTWNNLKFDFSHCELRNMKLAHLQKYKNNTTNITSIIINMRPKCVLKHLQNSFCHSLRIYEKLQREILNRLDQWFATQVLVTKRKKLLQIFFQLFLQPSYKLHEGS